MLDGYSRSPDERLRRIAIAIKQTEDVRKLYPDASFSGGRWHAHSVEWEECDCAVLIPDSYSDSSAKIYYGKQLSSGVIVYMSGTDRYPLHIEDKDTVEALRSYMRKR